MRRLEAKERTMKLLSLILIWITGAALLIYLVRIAIETF